MATILTLVFAAFSAKGSHGVAPPWMPRQLDTSTAWERMCKMSAYPSRAFA